MIKDIVFQKKFPRLFYSIAAWHFFHVLTRRASPLACGFYISSHCNFRCSFCNIWRMKPGFQMPRDESVRFIGELGSMGLVYFSISGGEPLLVPYVFDLLEHAKRSGILYTHLVSNGYLMDAEKAGKLDDAGVSEVSFSIDGDEKTHDVNRGVEGAFRRVLEAVNHVKKRAPGTKIVLNSILNPLNPEQAVFAVQTAEGLGIKIKVQPSNDHPSFGLAETAGKTNRRLNADGKNKLLEAIRRIQASRALANSSPFLENYKAFLFSPDDLLFRKSKCIFGRHHIEVFERKMYPCLEGLDWKDGFDIFRTSVEETIRSSQYQEKLRQLETCGNCKKNYYVCYYEPRLAFPVWNFLAARMKTVKV